MSDVFKRRGRFRDALREEELLIFWKVFVPSWLRDVRSGKESSCPPHLLREQEEDEQKIREGA